MAVSKSGLLRSERGVPTIVIYACHMMANLVANYTSGFVMLALHHPSERCTRIGIEEAASYSLRAQTEALSDASQ